ncbi:hypothetical protein [Altibacter sp. HG106]|uniref:hypothetical protein n=1 Tax=Altibacter sp. HG106 TaxID=3023937 RepID=UPI0023507651|nr:hypothetical protein [Altibacter sp. HG106]MDC7995978.1 hypothetical protein [Altibacter sp. HG106]
MMRRFFVLMVLITIMGQGLAQTSLHDYSYIVVPTQFEFTKGKDAFRLNTLTRYRLRQMGFDAVWQEELPEAVTRCEAAYVDAESSGGFINTKVRILVRDCNNMIVFSSITGSSKEKEYEIAYREAFEEALESFLMTDDTTTTDIAVVSEENSGDNSQEEITPAKTAVELSTDRPTSATKPNGNSNEVTPEATFVSGAFEIKKENNKYVLLKEGMKVGALTAMSQKNMYLITSSELTGIVQKTVDGFEAEVRIAGEEELTMMKFKNYESN